MIASRAFTTDLLKRGSSRLRAFVFLRVFVKSRDRLWSCEFVRSMQPCGELSVHLCWSSEAHFQVPAVRGCLLAFLDSRAADVRRRFQSEDQR